MKGIILAAGIASRLRPLTDNTPKCLLELGDETILGRTIDNLIANGINDLVIVTGYLQEQIIDFVNKKYPDLKVQFLYNEKYDSTNNIYSLWMTKDLVINDDVLLLDSDILFDKKIVTMLLDSDHANCLAVKSGFELSEEEIKVTLDDDECITEISKTVDPKLAIGESIGIEKFSNSYVKQLFAILDDMILNQYQINIFYEAAFERSLKEGAKIYIADVGDLRCMELDTVEDVETAKKNVVNYL
ncbi:MAG: phosphocholine cytidylyltransferase family protein [Melioribacteraceae bacterium]|nr:phosphocholine cytidylyltransferase family protein [Melioribacteraceae bacterium]